MTTSAFNATVVYIQDSQSPAEKRLALNLMINMLSQNTDKSGKTLLDQNVHCIARDATSAWAAFYVTLIRINVTTRPRCPGSV
jgi:hypothetical protein